jgi:cardiolipin synthase
MAPFGVGIFWKTDPVTDPDRIRRSTDRLHGLLGTPSTSGNEVTVLRNGDQIFPAMLSAIDDARHTVDFVTFVYWTGPVADDFAESLVGAAQRGCRVRILLDALGGRKIESRLVDKMKDAGCEFRWFRPFFDKAVPKFTEANRRTHRKILVCDNEVGFCGGVGIAEEWMGDARDETEWRDTHLEIRGPAVAGLLTAFLDNWADQHDDGFDPRNEQPVDFTERGDANVFVIRGAAETGASDVWRLNMTLLSLAEKRLRIATAYFNPGPPLRDALIAAVERGVYVTLLVPGEHADKRFIQIAGEESYQRLLDAGIDIRTYERSMMHAKVITVDGHIASVGSTNFNQRSMQFDEEANVVIVDEDVVAILEAQHDEDLELSIELDPSRWADRSIGQKAAEKVSAVVDKWL